MIQTANPYATTEFLQWAQGQAKDISLAATSAGCRPEQLHDFLRIYQAGFSSGAGHKLYVCPRPLNSSWLKPLPSEYLLTASNLWAQPQRKDQGSYDVSTAMVRAIYLNQGALVSIYSFLMPEQLLLPILMNPINPAVHESPTFLNPDSILLTVFSRCPDAAMALAPHWESGLSGPDAELFALSAAEFNTVALHYVHAATDRYSETVLVARVAARLYAFSDIRMTERAARLALAELSALLTSPPTALLPMLPRGGRVPRG